MDGKNEQTPGYIGTLHTTYETGDTVYDDAGNPYIAVEASEWRDEGYYETLVIPRDERRVQE